MYGLRDQSALENHRTGTASYLIIVHSSFTYPLTGLSSVRCVKGTFHPCFSVCPKQIIWSGLLTWVTCRKNYTYSLYFVVNILHYRLPGILFIRNAFDEYGVKRTYISFRVETWSHKKVTYVNIMNSLVRVDFPFNPEHILWRKCLDIPVAPRFHLQGCIALL